MTSELVNEHRLANNHVTPPDCRGRHVADRISTRRRASSGE